MVFNIDFFGQCDGCHFNDGPGALATIGSQLHLLVFVGLWLYSFITREYFIWTVNTIATLLLALCHIFHKVDVLGKQPPCLGCVAAIYARFYDLEGSAVPCAPVALVVYYMIILFACTLEFGSAYRLELTTHRCTHDHHRVSKSEMMEWKTISHLDVLIVPCWSAAARLYAGLTTTMGVVSGVVVGIAAAAALFLLVRSNGFRLLVRYVADEVPLVVCGVCIGPVPGIAATLKWFNFNTRLLDILWNNMDQASALSGGPLCARGDDL